MSETNTIGKEFTLPGLIRFVSMPVLTNFLLSILMTLDDSIFISRFIGHNALAAFAIAMPVFMLTGAVSELFNGSSVYCSTKMGEGKLEEAKSDFTTVCLSVLVTGGLFTVLGVLFMDPFLRFLGATDLLFPYVKSFFSISIWYIPLSLLANVFSRFYVVAGAPRYMTYSMIIGTVGNFFFDWLFIVQLKLGIAGGAYANLVAQIGLVLLGLSFYGGSKCEIGFSKPHGKVFSLLKNCFKLGFPQFLTNVALALNSFIANQVLLDIGGETSVSAYSIVNNIQFMFMGSLFSLSGTVTPMVSYAYGEKNNPKIRRILKQIIILTSGMTVLIIVGYLLGKNFLMGLYIRPEDGEAVRSMASYGLLVAPLAFVVFGYNVMGIDVLVALNDHKRSSALTMLENLVFANLAIIVLPYLFGLDGIWFAFAAGEALTFIFTVVFFRQKERELKTA